MFTKTLSAAALALVVTTPAFAAQHEDMSMDDMTCADFMAMSEEDQAALAAMRPTATGSDALADGSEDEAGADMATPGEDGQETMTDLAQACEGNDDMMVNDAMSNM